MKVSFYKSEIWTKAGCFLLACLLTFSAVTKIFAPEFFIKATAIYGLANPLLSFILLTIIEMTEILLALLLIIPTNKLFGVLGTTLLSSFFLGLSFYSWIQGVNTPCGCFGPFSLPIGSLWHLILCSSMFFLSGLLLINEIIFKKISGLRQKATMVGIIFGLFTIIAISVLSSSINTKNSIHSSDEKINGKEITDFVDKLIEIDSGRVIDVRALINNQVAIIGIFDLKCDKCINSLQYLAKIVKNDSYLDNLKIFAIVRTFSIQHLKLFINRFGITLNTYFLPYSGDILSNDDKVFLNKSAFYLIHKNRIIQSTPLEIEILSKTLNKANEILQNSKHKNIEKPLHQFHSSSSLKIEVIDTIGCKDCNDNQEIFMNIRDTNIGTGDSLYILDNKSRIIRIFSPSGLYERTIFLSDEIEDPSSIAPTSDGNIYVVDQLHWNLGVVFRLDKKGKILQKFVIHFMPWRIRLLEDYLFINSIPYYGKHTKFLIHKFTRNGELINEFCHQRPEWFDESKDGGMNGFISVSSKFIGFAFGYPYDIRIFSSNGDSLNSLIRNPSFYGELLSKSQENGPKLQWWSGVTEGITMLDNKYLISLICNTKEWKVLADVWSIKDGEFLGTVDIGNIVSYCHLYAPISSANSGMEFYIRLFRPYPHLLKLRLIISDK